MVDAERARGAACPAPRALEHARTSKACGWSRARRAGSHAATRSMLDLEVGVDRLVGSAARLRAAARRAALRRRSAGARLRTRARLLRAVDDLAELLRLGLELRQRALQRVLVLAV